MCRSGSRALKGQARVGHQSDVRGAQFAHFALVDIDMHELGLGAEFVQASGGAVVKTGAHGQEQVAFFKQHIGAARAVHAEHAQGERVIVRHDAKALHGHGDRDALAFGDAANDVGAVSRVGAGDYSSPTSMMGRWLALTSAAACSRAAASGAGPLWRGLGAGRGEGAVIFSICTFLGISTSTGPGGHLGRFRKPAG